MKVFCPNCGTGYLVPQNKVPQKPRMLICRDCNSSWKHNFEFHAKSNNNNMSSSDFSKPDLSSLRKRPSYPDAVLTILREEAELEAKLRN